MQKFKFFSVLSLFILLGIISCTEDQEILEGPVNSPAVSTINFLQESYTLKKDTAALEIQLSLQPAAVASGEISLKVSGDAAYRNHYSTLPAVEDGYINLEVEKGQQIIKLTLTPIEQGTEDGDKHLNLSIDSASPAIKKGAKTVTQITLRDQVDPEPNPGGQPVAVSFADSVVSISEEEFYGQELVINLSGVVSHTEIIMLSITAPAPYTYDTNYSTVPNLSLNEMKLDVIPSMEEVAFRIVPINDHLLGADYEILISMKSVSTGLEQGAIRTMKVRIVEDDIPQGVVHSIAEVRARFEQFSGSWYFPEDYLVEGIVTSGNNVNDKKTLYLQDSTAGIMLHFSLPPHMEQGDKVVINLKGGEGHEVNGQKAIMSIADIAGTIIARDQQQPALTIRLSELDPQIHQGRLLMIRDIEFADANGQRTFAGSNRIVQEGSSAYMHTYETYAPKNMLLPRGKKTVIGILGDWNMILPQNSPYIGEWF